MFINVCMDFYKNNNFMSIKIREKNDVFNLIKKYSKSMKIYVFFSK